MINKLKGESMKFLVMAIFGIGLGATTTAQSLGISGGGFAAPTIDGKENVYNPTVGEIIYDSSDGAFYGRNQSSGWVAFSGTTSGMPIGAILTFAGPNCPNGFLSADGAAISRTTYANLFDVLGTSHGSGDGSTTFNIPDYRGRFLRGVDDDANRDPDDSTRTAMNPGGNAGDNIGSVQDDAFQGHRHPQTPNAVNQSLGYSQGNDGFSQANANGSINNALNSGDPITDGANGTPKTSSETRPTNAYVNYCIKY